MHRILKHDFCMKTKHVFGLLLVAVLVLKGTCAYASAPITVEAGETTATLTWPTDSAASKYQIDIYKDGETFCHLTLGAKGQLLGISFNAPWRKAVSNHDHGLAIRQGQADSSLPETLSFMVTGLDVATRYNYVLSVLNESGTPLHVYIGDFATADYTGDLRYPDGFEVIPTPPIIPGNPEANAPSGTGTVSRDGFTGAQKVVKDGVLLFQIDGKTYSITGQKIH